MNKFKRDITYQGNIRLVGDVPIERDADFAILYERDNYLEIVKKFLNLEAKDIEQHEDHKLLHYTLPNRARVVMADAQGAAFSASAVEKFIRAGISHVVRVGTQILNLGISYLIMLRSLMKAPQKSIWRKKKVCLKAF